MNEQNLNVEQLSQLSTLSKNTINNILNCKSEPNISVLQKICDVFNISTCEFFDDIICSYYLKNCV